MFFGVQRYNYFSSQIVSNQTFSDQVSFCAKFCQNITENLHVSEKCSTFAGKIRRSVGVAEFNSALTDKGNIPASNAVVTDKGWIKADPIFTERPFVRPMSRKGQLQTMYNYIRMNPQRLATKRLNPGYFYVQEHVGITKESDHRPLSFLSPFRGLGGLFLFSRYARHRHRSLCLS